MRNSFIKRNCLKCDAEFKSEGTHNRLCYECKVANNFNVFDALNRNHSRFSSKRIESDIGLIVSAHTETVQNFTDYMRESIERSMKLHGMGKK